MKEAVFKGCATALITPFTHDAVDYAAFRRLIDFQLEAGINALVVCGTTGEASTMSYAERIRTIETAVDHVGGRVPVIAGTGSNSTETAVALSRDAERIGVDALLVVTPYYNKATQRGLVRHYEMVADLVSKPVMVYNVPSRTGVSCSAETYAALSAHPNIIGVKEASGNLSLVQKTRELCPDDFYIWSGNDDETAPIMLLGGAGVISVVSNAAPHEMVSLTQACLNGEFRKAGEQQLRLRRLCEVLFCEVNPIPVKTALSMMGYCSEIFRLPLCEMSGENRSELKQALRSYALL
ncbi:MAG: 4-hydroxy-tetrahydrodipicolinate synthase [Oscillospiraceae bacterium]|nr:4-hydroxy-tetrahydrodipicolinate synthase [Oscillospiraceae bacterium]